MAHGKRLRSIALRNQVKQTERLFRILQDQALLTSAWSLPELKILLLGGSYDLFLCVTAFRGGACSEALRQVQEYFPLLPKLVILLNGENYNLAKMEEAVAAEVITPRISEDSLLQMLEDFAAEIKPAPARAAVMALPARSKKQYPALSRIVPRAG